jgi:hypothetical protein
MEKAIWMSLRGALGPRSLVSRATKQSDFSIEERFHFPPIAASGAAMGWEIASSALIKTQLHQSLLAMTYFHEYIRA